MDGEKGSTRDSQPYRFLTLTLPLIDPVDDEKGSTRDSQPYRLLTLTLPLIGLEAHNHRFGHNSAPPGCFRDFLAHWNRVRIAQLSYSDPAYLHEVRTVCCSCKGHSLSCSCNIWHMTHPYVAEKTRTEKVTQTHNYFRELPEIRKFWAHQDSGQPPPTQGAAAAIGLRV